MKSFYPIWAQAVDERDKGLHQSVHMTILCAHVQFQIYWVTHQGEKWILADGQTDRWSFLCHSSTVHCRQI